MHLGSDFGLTVNTAEAAMRAEGPEQHGASPEGNP